MRIIKVGSAEVVECIHCQGTGICKEAVHLPGTDETNNISYYECTKCGRGIIAAAGSKPPVCAICGGKGYNRP
jgi:hypothetical protein